MPSYFKILITILHEMFLEKSGAKQCCDNCHILSNGPDLKLIDAYSTQVGQISYENYYIL